MFGYSYTIYFHSPFMSHFYWQYLLAKVLIMFAKAFQNYLPFIIRAVPGSIVCIDTKNKISYPHKLIIQGGKEHRNQKLETIRCHSSCHIICICLVSLFKLIWIVKELTYNLFSCGFYGLITLVKFAGNYPDHACQSFLKVGSHHNQSCAWWYYVHQ